MVYYTPLHGRIGHGYLGNNTTAPSLTSRTQDMLFRDLCVRGMLYVYGNM